MKTISVKDETWRSLSKLKAELMHPDLDRTINFLFSEHNSIDGMMDEVKE